MRCGIPLRLVATCSSLELPVGYPSPGGGVFMDPQAPSDVSCQKQQVSQRKIEANRKNSRASTGPKTLLGKKTASRNATKHGLFATEVVNVAQGESPQRFRGLLQKLWDEHQPVGYREEILVEKIAVFYWRQARILRAENGESSKALIAARREGVKKIDQFSIDRMQWELMRAARETGRIDLTVPFVERGMAQEEVIRNLGRTARGNEFVRDSLRRIKEHIETTGSLPDPLRTFLLDCLGIEWLYLLPDKTADGTILDENELKSLSTF